MLLVLAGTQDMPDETVDSLVVYLKSFAAEEYASDEPHARIAALEWGGERIRINTLHPDAVFDTAIWSDEILQARAAHYGMSVSDYKTKNLLKTEISSDDVAALSAALCSRLFAKTTGAQIPIDGGNDRVI